jgi:ABC-type nitrate/sulfonate/bicarbonate transport system ATPase subunit
VKEPKVLYADRPTNGLDEDTRDEIINLIEALARTQAHPVLVTHDTAIGILRSGSGQSFARSQGQRPRRVVGQLALPCGLAQHSAATQRSKQLWTSLSCDGGTSSCR